MKINKPFLLILCILAAYSSQAQFNTLPAFKSLRVYGDTVSPGIIYTKALTNTDSLLNFTQTGNKGLSIRPAYAFNANNQYIAAVEIVPVNQTTGGPYTNTFLAALRTSGSIVASLHNTFTIGFSSDYWQAGYFATTMTNAIQAGFGATVEFKDFSGARVGGYSGFYNNFTFGNIAPIKVDQARLSVQGDQFAISGFARGIGIDDTLRASKNGDTLIGLDASPIIPTSGGTIAAVTITSAGSGFTNGNTLASTTGGSGTGARVLLTVSGGAATSVAITTGGKNYKVGDVLTLSGLSGFSMTVTAVGLSNVKAYAARFNGDINLNYIPPAPTGNAYKLLVKDTSTGNIAQLPAAAISTEYLDYQSGDYTINANNGTVQNIVFQLSADATLTLPTPTSNLILYVSNMSNFHLNTSQAIYTTDATSNTFISNQTLKLGYIITKGKWYRLL